MYHASLTPATKHDIRTGFEREDGIRCIVATIAFGMVSSKSTHKMIIQWYILQGMDIPDIQFVIVYGVPKNMSHLHQVAI